MDTKMDHGNYSIDTITFHNLQLTNDNENNMIQIIL